MNLMQQSDVIQKTEQYVRELLSGDKTGHDWWHTKRVHNVSLHIAEEETKIGTNVNIFVVQLAALLHDIADWKFQNGDESVGPQKAMKWLESIGVDKNTSSHVCQIIKDISFKGAGVSDDMPTTEGAIVQDADRLDALGATGIARCFATGTKLGNTIYDPEIFPTIHNTVYEYKKLRSTSINHFYEKLFLLKDRMKTNTGKKLAEERHHYMEMFIQRFLSEWNGEL
jgi:uncharacterized protein